MRAIERAARAISAINDPELWDQTNENWKILKRDEARAAVLAFLEGVDVEAVARAHWNTLPSVGVGTHIPWGETGVTYKHLGWVLWDDEDMSETDRSLFRDKATAILAALRAEASDEVAMLYLTYPPDPAMFRAWQAFSTPRTSKPKPPRTSGLRPAFGRTVAYAPTAVWSITLVP